MTITMSAHARGFAVLTVLAILAGCTTPRPPTAARADLADLADLALYTDAADQVWFNGKPYPVERLATALKTMRVPRNQPIRINIPDSTKRDLFARVATALRVAGFSRVFFVSEQHAESHVKEPGIPNKPARPRAAP
jgi:biopolymer transport protein ExbD